MRYTAAITLFVCVAVAFPFLGSCTQGENQNGTQQRATKHKKESDDSRADKEVIRAELVEELGAVPRAIDKLLASGGTFADICPDAENRQYFEEIDETIRLCGRELVYFYLDDSDHELPEVNNPERQQLKRERVFLSEEVLKNALETELGDQDTALVVEVLNPSRTFPLASLICFKKYGMGSDGEITLKTRWPYFVILKPANPHAEDPDDLGIIVDSINMP